MFSRFEDILVECIEDIKAGRSIIEECLQRYPSNRERLEPLLRIALRIRRVPDVKPSLAFRTRARAWLMQEINGRASVSERAWLPRTSPMRRMTGARRFGLARMAAAIGLGLFVLAGGTAYASQASLPGDVLYPVKLGTEQIGMVLSGGDVARAERGLAFADRRIEEVQALTEEGRSEYLDRAVDKYEYALDAALARIEEADNRGMDTENITTLAAEATASHAQALEKVYGEVPEQAQSAIERAIQKSLTGHDTALAALGQMGVDVSQLPGIPQQVRQRLEDILGGIPPTPGPPGGGPGP
ncbi:MAG: DUF5667 domain-containing protein [Dehalococcoidia bacterium]